MSSAVTATGATSTYLGSALTASPSAFYRLDEQSGTVMADSSGNEADESYLGHETLRYLCRSAILHAASRASLSAMNASAEQLSDTPPPT
jgi:hypothetical protein